MNKMRHFVILFLFSMMALAIQAQTTMTSSNYPRQGTFAHTYSRDVSGVTLPSRGASQTWDYSGLSEESTATHNHMNATGDSVFTNVNTFQGMIYEADHFEGLSTTAWTLEGRRIYGEHFPLQAMTGDPLDSLIFLDHDDVFATPLDQLQFPASFSDAWTNSYMTHTPFELTVNAYMVVNAPGDAVEYKTCEYEVVGDGQLVIPMISGAPAPAREVILVRKIETTVDSTFLYGAPAPPPLMTAFGLVQGDITIDTTYNFYTPNLTSELLTVGPPNGLSATNWANYSIDAIPLGLEENISSSVAYPNPVESGNTFNIEFESGYGASFVKITSMIGQVVYEEETSFSGKLLQIEIPASIGAGRYILQVGSDKKRVKPILIQVK